MASAKNNTQKPSKRNGATREQHSHTVAKLDELTAERRAELDEIRERVRALVGSTERWELIKQFDPDAANRSQALADALVSIEKILDWLAWDFLPVGAVRRLDKIARIARQPEVRDERRDAIRCIRLFATHARERPGVAATLASILDSYGLKGVKVGSVREKWRRLEVDSARGKPGRMGAITMLAELIYEAGGAMGIQVNPEADPEDEIARIRGRLAKDISSQKQGGS